MRNLFLTLCLAALCCRAAYAADSYTALVASMQPKNGVGLERLRQTDLQAACSNSADSAGDAQRSAALREQALASVVKPADGSYLGDWRAGEAVAVNGRGLQYSDDQSAPNGGNCYACHQLDPEEIAYGTLGPSLTNYGQRGQSQPILEYTWTKLYNPHAYLVCSHMPRFGDAGILTEQQLKDLMAYLLDPASPVNRKQD